MNFQTAAGSGWLAFELSVLRRLKFESVILPLARKPLVGAYLKRLNARVSANDFLLGGWTQAVALIENNSEKLTDEETSFLLEDVYIPRFEAQNTALGERFGEIDAVWFANFRRNVERLSSRTKKAIALSAALNIGNYVLSFDEKTRSMRQPLSCVFRRFLNLQLKPFDNGQNNRCENKKVKDFIAENPSDLMFLNLPQTVRANEKSFSGSLAWQEEWLGAENDFPRDLQGAKADDFGAPVETKSQYLYLLEEILQTASHIPSWAIAFSEDNFISLQEIAETIGRTRTVNTIFTKDFSELGGSKAVIITA